MARPPRARDAALDAAERVLLRHGPSALTLDAVAVEAGVSKGGLIYHFPAKEALLRALVARAVEAVDRSLADAARADAPGAFARAYLATTIPEPQWRPAQPPGPQGPGATAPSSGPELVAALAGAASQDSTVLDPLREAYARWQDRLERDGIPPAAATAVRLAVDGWWLGALLGLPPLSVAVHEQTRVLLLGLTRPAADE